MRILGGLLFGVKELCQRAINETKFTAKNRELFLETYVMQHIKIRDAD